MFKIKILELRKIVIATLQYHMLAHGEIIISSHGGNFVQLCLIGSKGYCVSQPSPLKNINTEI